MFAGGTTYKGGSRDEGVKTQGVEAPRDWHRWEAISISRDEGTRKGQRVLEGPWWKPQLRRDVVMATELMLKQRGQGGGREALAPFSSYLVILWGACHWLNAGRRKAGDEVLKDEFPGP